tara:strand:- start:49587 stop:50756 length:1170 start_codon:yes stop_codon:yes gene_type:complete
MWAVLVLLVGSTASYLLLVGKPEPLPQVAPQPQPVTVDVLPVVPANIALSVETQGTVHPRREINLVSQVAGRVESVSPRFAEGGFFSASEPLVKVQDVDYMLAIARAESQVAAARQRVAEEEGRALQARREWRDVGTDQGNALFLRKPQLAAAKAALAAAQADLKAAQLDLERTSIGAPFNGRISKKFVDIGQYVTPGTAIATVYDTDVVQVRLPLTDRQVALLDLPLNYANVTQAEFEGVPVALRAQFGGRQWEWEGRIVRTDATIDVDSRVVYAVAEVTSPFAREEGSDRPPLSPGLFVHATISGREMADVAQLPRSALRNDGSVMVVDADQRARVREVQVLQSNARQVWVQGLERGARVIVREPAPTVAGMKVLVDSTAEVAAGGF